MKIFRHTLAFCSLMVVPFMASATPSLPQPQDVKTAIERALDSIELLEPTSGNREERNQFLIQRSSIKSIRSSDVLSVPGCVIESEQSVSCIIEMDRGMGKIGYINVPLEYQSKRWEAPFMATIFDSGATLPAVPSPTLEQAQKALIQSAKDSNDENAKLIQRGLIKLISIQPNCELDANNGNITCAGKISKRATEQQKEEVIEIDNIHFHLKDSEWIFGRAES
ncbi:hypothetical protein [Serratia fonticola]|uniref:hypothetical protein n=1 Tax=Serratia fonticola TaxID=47917 RepID=UPI002179B752|nr:hypothetical protein [Serratia fonticola]CAI1738961.1 Uncharacterised protein [Serratia fonticola]